jgi:SAM-dependent methyltransferase
MSQEHASHPVDPNDDDLLWRHLKTVPAFRALLRSVEARFYRQTKLPGPILDLGCGDGHFATLAFEEPLMAGIDPWSGPLSKARRAGAHRLVINGLGDALPFPDGYFGSVISNSVLEHILDIQPVLNDIARVLQPGGTLVVTMPSDNYTAWLGGALWFEKLKMNGLADRYRRLFNRIARHAHTDGPELWARRLTDAGLVVDRWQYYFSERALHALEIGHYYGLPSLILHFFTGRWIIAPWRSNLYFTEKWLRPLYRESTPAKGSMLLFKARKPHADNEALDRHSTR